MNKYMNFVKTGNPIVCKKDKDHDIIEFVWVYNCRNFSQEFHPTSIKLLDCLIKSENERKS